MAFRHHIYRRLGQNKAEFLKRVQALAREVGMPSQLHGAVGLTGSNSARPAYLRPDIIAKMAEGARSPKNLVAYVEEIRDVVKEGYGDDFDALPINTCEAALWVTLDTFAAPPLAGRGGNYRCRYVGLYEAHAEHQLAYGRPFPPKYKDLFADRANIGGELGVLGRRLENLDVIIVPIEGARYEPHGIKPFIVPLLTTANAAKTKQRVRSVIERHVDQVSALISLGYDSPGYGYGEKSDGVTSDLKAAMGSLAQEFDVPYIVDNARAIPFLGAHPRSMQADLMLFSMDKVAGAPTSGLIVGRPHYIIALQRAIGWHSERFGGGSMTFGKGAFASQDPGREGLVGQLAALRWCIENKNVLRGVVDRLYDITREECEPLIARYGNGIVLSKSYNGGAVEINYVDTWNDGKVGIPVFSTEDKAASMNYVVAGLAELGILPCGPDEGNMVITTGRGLVDEGGQLDERIARPAVRALVRVLLLLGDLAEEYVQ
jgi:hypothetical protein